MDFCAELAQGHLRAISAAREELANLNPQRNLVLEFCNLIGSMYAISPGAPDYGDALESKANRGLTRGGYCVSELGAMRKLAQAILASAQVSAQLSGTVACGVNSATNVPACVITAIDHMLCVVD